MKNKRKGASGQERISKELQRQFGDPTLPNYRFYGVKRRVYPRLEKAIMWAGRIFFSFLVLCFIYAVGATAWAFFVYFPEIWLRLLVGIFLFVLLLLKLTQNFRRRRKCRRKLIKVCRKTGATVTFRKGFLRTCSWNGEREDFRVETAACVYVGHYMGVKKYGTKMYIEGKGMIRLKHSPIQSFFTVMFDIRSTHISRPICKDLPDQKGKMGRRVLLIHPNCYNIWYKEPGGGYESTGNGGEHYGLTVYRIEGLCDAIRRDAAK